MGLEALSRGCPSVVFLEESKKMTGAIEASLTDLGYEAKVMTGDFRRLLPTLAGQSFAVIFADPPYKTPFAKLVVETVDRYDLLSDGGVMVVEHLRGYEFPLETKHLEKFDLRHYGQTGLSFFRKAGKNC